MKKIIVCCDGTWNKPGMLDMGEKTETNVLKFYNATAGNDAEGNSQVKFYAKGVGTGGWLDSFRGGAFGAGLNAKIIEAYKFIMENFEPGDAIYLTGFSRGAYTARSTAGFIRNSGILKKEKHHLLPNAFNLYRNRDEFSHPDSAHMHAFRKDHSSETNIKFIGVWDTVGALGVPFPRFNTFNQDTLRVAFHDLKLSAYVENAFHALAIDERRKVFAPALWQQSPNAGKDKAPLQVLEQVWFSGSHSNVGGGYKDKRPSDISLRWMIDKARSCGLCFNEDFIEQNILTDDEKCEGVLRNSKTLAYRAFSDDIRRMGKTANGFEDVHVSAINRREKFEEYNAPNLVNALVNAGIRAWAKTRKS